MKTLKGKKEFSFNCGVEAFNQGKPCIPAFDQKFLNEIVTGLKNGESAKFMKEWLKGWHTANLNKPIE